MVVAFILFFAGMVSRNVVDEERQHKLNELKFVGGSAVEAIGFYRYSTFVPNLMMSLSPAFVGFAILAHGGSIVIGLLFALVGAALTTLCLVYRDRLYI
jgi:hypothetical protein